MWGDHGLYKMMFKYEVKVKCSNCGTGTTIKVPKRTTIKEYLESRKARCSYCGCNTITALAKKPEDYLKQ